MISSLDFPSHLVDEAGVSNPRAALSRHVRVAVLAGDHWMAIIRLATFHDGAPSASSRSIEETSMKLVLTLLGVVLLVIAAVYVLVPADQLPGFFPGHEAGVTRVHLKHGAVSGVLGLVLMGAGVWMGRRNA